MKKVKSWHYKRICQYCGFVWAGLHCIHDGYQNPCPNCKQRPKFVKDKCNCEFNWEDEEEYVNEISENNP